MVDATIGWAVTDSRILRTADGGETWLDRTPPALAETSLQTSTLGDTQFGRLSDAAFLGADALWVALFSAGKIEVFATGDAGKHWQQGVLELGTTTGEAGDLTGLVGIDFVNPKDGWIVANLGGGAGSQPVGVHRTEDGGLTWQTVAIPTPETHEPGGLPFGGDKTGFAFADPKHGWLTGSSAANGIWLFSTSDGGDTWQQATLTVPADPSAAAMHKDFPTTMPPVFINDHDGVLSVSGGTGTQGDVFVTEFYTTSDGGRHWRATTPLVTRDDWLQSWSWPDAAHGFAANDSEFCITGDSGRTWRSRDLPAALKGITQIDFVSSSIGWAVASGRLFKTTDGGDSWVRQR